MTTIVTLAGEGEYESDVTMRPIAEAIAVDLGATLDYRTPSVIKDVPDFPESSFGGLDALAEAKLLIVYTRFRVLPDEEVAALASYLERGGAMVALRTSNHAFHPVPGSPWEDWTARFANRYLGSAWSAHHGHSSRTRVEVVANDPITAGLPPIFEVDSWLYVNVPPAGARILLAGEPIDPEIPAQPSPVAWSWDDHGRRVFYTSLGSRSDLERPELLCLLTQAARWAIAENR